MKQQGETGTWSKVISGRRNYSAYSQEGFGRFGGGQFQPNLSTVQDTKQPYGKYKVIPVKAWTDKP
jgi:hypothetical protein